MAARSQADWPTAAGTDRSAAGAGRILVIRGGAIGDFVLTLPVLAALREQFGQCQLDVLGYPHIASLAVRGGLADAVRSIESRALAQFFGAGSDLDAGWADYFEGFALIVSYLYDPDAVFQTNVARCSKAQFVPGPHRPDERLELHATETFLRPLERLAIFHADPVPRLQMGPDDPQTLEGNVCGPLILHPGSGSERKNWPEPAWRELLERLAERSDWEFLLVGGEAEGERVARLESVLPAGRVQSACNLPLPDLAARLNQGRAYVGHDSGITHLAAAVGLPGLVLWGESNEAIWRPRSTRFRVVRSARGLGTLEVTRVLEELDELLSGSE